MAMRVIISVTEPALKLPEGPNDTSGKVAFLKWESEFNANCNLQHCTLEMRSKLNSMNEWEIAEVTQDGILLTNMISSISNKHDK